MEKSGLTLSSPVAILLAGILIALSVLYVGKGVPAVGGDLPLQEARVDVRPLSEGDHVLGSRDAEVFVIEYSDLECPFCRVIHETLEQVVAASDGKVAWIYRHFPLTSIHPEALPSALAAECVASLGGGESFWRFTSIMFGNQDKLSSALYGEAAGALGVDTAAFEQCIANRTFEGKIKADFDEALAAGGQGTPFVVLRTREGKTASFSGALSRANIEQLIEDVQR